MNHTNVIYFFLIIGVVFLIDNPITDTITLDKQTKQIISVTSLLIAYYYYNNEKLF